MVLVDETFYNSLPDRSLSRLKRAKYKYNKNAKNKTRPAVGVATAIGPETFNGRYNYAITYDGFFRPYFTRALNFAYVLRDYAENRRCGSISDIYIYIFTRIIVVIIGYYFYYHRRAGCTWRWGGKNINEISIYYVIIIFCG